MAQKRQFDLYEDGPVLADALKLQIYVYEKVGNKKIFQYPEERDLSRPTVLLFYQNGNGASASGHVGLILAKSFFNGHFQCPFCNKNVGYREKLHYCQNTCYACKGFKVSSEENVHINNVAERGLCRTENKYYRESYLSCIKCRVTCFSQECFKKHISSGVCQMGFFCPTCFHQ